MINIISTSVLCGYLLPYFIIYDRNHPWLQPFQVHANSYVYINIYIYIIRVNMYLHNIYYYVNIYIIRGIYIYVLTYIYIPIGFEIGNNFETYSPE